uniref:H15 domain-containing protein n=1 Tax=Ditylenchus dipsaci TaxID=166011 RepID=A0A915EL24_9BILA
MVVTAIESLEGGKKGSSNQAITKYVTENFDVASNVKIHINNALKKGVEDKLLVQIHGVGASGSFRLATSSKKRSKSVTTVQASDDAPPPKKVKSPAKQAKKAKSPAKSAAKKAQSPTAKGKKGADAAAKKVTKKAVPAKLKASLRRLPKLRSQRPLLRSLLSPRLRLFRRRLPLSKNKNFECSKILVNIMFRVTVQFTLLCHPKARSGLSYTRQ